MFADSIVGCPNLKSGPPLGIINFFFDEEKFCTLLREFVFTVHALAQRLLCCGHVNLFADFVYHLGVAVCALGFDAVGHVVRWPRLEPIGVGFLGCRVVVLSVVDDCGPDLLHV